MKVHFMATINGKSPQIESAWRSVKSVSDWLLQLSEGIERVILVVLRMIRFRTAGKFKLCLGKLNHRIHQVTLGISGAASQALLRRINRALGDGR